MIFLVQLTTMFTSIRRIHMCKMFLFAFHTETNVYIIIGYIFIHCAKEPEYWGGKLRI